MKASFISTFLLLLPFFAQVPALTVPESLIKNSGGSGSKGGAGTKKSTSSAASSTSSSAASTTSTSAAAASTSATAGGNATNSTTVTVATNSTAGAGNTGDPQTSLTLDPAVISKGFENNGQSVPAAGQVASLTSSNNFINFCLTVPLPLTNGQQVTTGSCNTAPMGVIAASTAMPSAKFTNPKNGDTIAANTAFTISLAVNNFATGFFVNAQQNYFAAPQQVNAQGLIQGHSHVVVEALSALDQTTPTDPTKFFFFKGMNTAAVGGVLTADVTNGLPAGVYKVSSINTAANHQPCLVAIAQHGSLDDAVYFTVTNGGAAAGGGAAGANSTASSTAAATPPAANSATASSVAASTPVASSTSPAAKAGASSTVASAPVASSSSAAAKKATASSSSVAASATASATAGKGNRNKGRFIARS